MSHSMVDEEGADQAEEPDSLEATLEPIPPAPAPSPLENPDPGPTEDPMEGPRIAFLQQPSKPKLRTRSPLSLGHKKAPRENPALYPSLHPLT